MTHSTKSAVGGPLTGAPHALLLDRLSALANPRGVEQRDRIAIEVEMHLDDVACGTRIRRHDRRLAPR